MERSVFRGLHTARLDTDAVFIFTPDVFSSRFVSVSVSLFVFTSVCVSVFVSARIAKDLESIFTQGVFSCPQTDGSIGDLFIRSLTDHSDQ